jgi:predicted MPP superfamily phosphohydrolase
MEHNVSTLLNKSLLQILLVHKPQKFKEANNKYVLY